MKAWAGLILIGSIFILIPSAAAELAWKYRDYVVTCVSRGDPIHSALPLSFQGIQP